MIDTIDQDENTPQFFLTAPQPCPYLPDHHERKIFTDLGEIFSQEINSVLTRGGFRRSQNIAYRPICDGCHACISVRIIVSDFKPDQTMKRVIKKNIHRFTRVCEPEATDEQYALFLRYLNARHSDGGMTGMTFSDYKMMVEDTHVKTHIIEYRTQMDNTNQNYNGGSLTAVALTDVIDDGLSMVYSFFDPNMKQSSLGVFLILDHIKRAKLLKLPYVYLGYWVKGSKKMDYKSRYRPLEYLTSEGWKVINM